MDERNHPASSGDRFAVETGWALEGQDSAGQSIRLVIGETMLGRAHLGIVVGRHPALSDVVIGDPSISKRHCRFSLADGELVIEDLNSMNGTWIEGEQVGRFQPGPVRAGEGVTLGKVELHLRRLDVR
ncbi:MAG: FHA domain-containing protein [Geminicoccaceae bacterium]